MPIDDSSSKFKLGLIINPVAGIGGALAQKGSDDLDEKTKLEHTESLSRSEQRALRAIAILQQSPCIESITFFCGSGSMGARVLHSLNIEHQIVYHAPRLSTGEDTKRTVYEMLERTVDLLLFVGGDGTARDIVDALAGKGCVPPVLGIPAGVKMHSGVYATSPEAAGELIVKLLRGKFIAVREAEVKDIDEALFRDNIVSAKHYGDLWVPDEGGFLQHVKVGGIEDPELAKQDIAEEVVERMEPGVMYIIGPGSTMAAVMEQLHLENTLLGVDVVLNGQLLIRDASEEELLDQIRLHQGACEIFVTAIGGQGHVLGRGNQQISPRVLALVGIGNLTICATKSKLASLQGRPMLVDSNDPAVDRQLEGYHRVITGYHDYTLYPIKTAFDVADNDADV